MIDLGIALERAQHLYAEDQAVDHGELCGGVFAKGGIGVHGLDTTRIWRRVNIH